MMTIKQLSVSLRRLLPLAEAGFCGDYCSCNYFNLIIFNTIRLAIYTSKDIRHASCGSLKQIHPRSMISGVCTVLWPE